MVMIVVFVLIVESVGSLQLLQVGGWRKKKNNSNLWTFEPPCEIDRV
jgi:hypothetical protein